MIGGIWINNYDPVLLDKSRKLLTNVCYLLATEITSERLIKMLNFIGSYDDLTGVRNRNSMLRKEEILRTYHVPFGVIFGDLNGLKRMNDTMGHSAGDELIKNAVSLLTHYYGKENTYRAGGDEFLVILEGIGEGEFNRRYDNFMNALKSYSSVSISTGAVWGEDSAHIDEALAEADRRMYEAKSRFYQVKGHDRRKR
jgi:diguanylate cyclase (GGDEF)-like protein